MKRAPLVLICLSPLILGGMWYAATADAGLPIVRFELAGDAAEAARIVGGRTSDYRAALTADYPFMAGYALTMSAACMLARRRVTGRAARLTLGLGAVAAPLAAVLDLLENLDLARGLTVMTDGPFARAAAFATAKFALLVPAMLVSVAALVVIGRSPGGGTPSGSPENTSENTSEDPSEGDPAGDPESTAGLPVPRPGPTAPPRH